MHPIICYELANPRMADFHRQAKQDQLARAVIQASRPQPERGKNPVAARPAGDRARRALTLLGSRSA
jgi:hypothetical protein